MKVFEQLQYRPNWLACLMLPLLHFFSVKLTLLCALSPEAEVVVWLPNAVLLAAFLHFRGQRAWLMAGLTFGSECIANWSVFPPMQVMLLNLVPIIEVTLTYLLMRRINASPGLERIQDLGKFVVAGPLIGALLSGLLAGVVLRTLPGVSAPYPTLVLLWWFGDGLGLLIYTPLLLAFARPGRDAVRISRFDGAATLLTVMLAGLVFSGAAEKLGGVSLTPNLLLPSVLYMAARLGARWTSLAVALISLATAWAQTTGHKPFGDAPAHELILRTQEFILTLSIVGMGFATLFSEQRALNRSLEDKVRERTHELQESNSKLYALSATDGLTGIANRRRFDEVLADEWNHAMRSGKPLALALLDVDLFKKYNDHYGHQAGDECLRLIAKAMTANARRAGDLVARYGGEEFVLVAPAANESSAMAMAEAICEALRSLSNPHALSPFGVVTASVGVAVLVPGQGENRETLIKLADEALYQAKARGRNQAVLAGDALPSMRAAA